MTNASEFRVETIAVPTGFAPAGAHPFTLSLSVTRVSHSASIAHVSNVEYVRWIDRISELHGEACGHSRAALLASGRMWFVSRHEVDYQRESFAGDQLACATWIASAGRTTVQRESVIWNRASQLSVCRASSRWVLIDLATRKPMRIAEAELSLLQPLTRR